MASVRLWKYFHSVLTFRSQMDLMTTGSQAVIDCHSLSHLTQLFIDMIKDGVQYNSTCSPQNGFLILKIEPKENAPQ